MSNKYLGSNFDDFLAEEGILEECQSIAIKRVLAYQLQKFMQDSQLSKTVMATKLNTSRAALNRLLDPLNTSITLETMIKVVQVTGKRISISIG